MDLSKYVIDLHGKPYMTVAGRIAEFWDKAAKGPASIITEVTQAGSIITVKAVATIGQLSAVGHASEMIGGSGVNRTNALENAETSAVGRALGNLGLGLLGAGGIASADEVQFAVAKGTTQESLPRVTPDEDVPVIKDAELEAAGLGSVDAPVLVCSNEGNPITLAEKEYSTKLYGKPLCRSCQSKTPRKVSRSTAAR